MRCVTVRKAILNENTLAYSAHRSSAQTENFKTRKAENESQTASTDRGNDGQASSKEVA